MQRPHKRLWVPNEGVRITEEPGRELEPQASRAAPSQEDDDTAEDDLDRLLDQYDQQAAAATQASQSAKQRPASQKGQQQLRAEGLAKAIETENRGFKMLQQMGFKAGEGLGRGVKGRTEPIELALKAGRTGLGVDEDRKRQRSYLQSQQQERATKRLHGQELLKGLFREQQAAQFANKRIEQHISHAREACETLDRRAGLPRSLMWPLERQATPEDDEEQEQQLPPDVQEWEDQLAPVKLHTLLAYLRSRHHHCLFCGTQYKDSQELAQLCPGEEEEGH